MQWHPMRAGVDKRNGSLLVAYYTFSVKLGATKVFRRKEMGVYSQSLFVLFYKACEMVDKLRM